LTVQVAAEEITCPLDWRRATTALAIVWMNGVDEANLAAVVEAMDAVLEAKSAKVTVLEARASTFKSMAATCVDMSMVVEAMPV
jgi:hypothetical protein